MRWFAAYVAAVVLANVALKTVGLVPVGFGLMAPAGVIFAGLCLSLRDRLDDVKGRRYVLAGIVTGAAISGLMSAQLAAASGVAFLVSEACDWIVYRPLRQRGRVYLAVVLSNTVGAVVDSALFLTLAGFGLAFLPGQLVGKAWATLAALVLMAAARNRCRLGLHNFKRGETLVDLTCTRCGARDTYNPYMYV